MPHPERREEICEECEGLGWVMRDDGGAGAARRCDCRKQRVADRRLEAAGIPERYAVCTLDGFRTARADSPDIPSGPLLKAHVRARRYVDRFPEHRELGLLFTGPPGVGKTHLAVAILSDVVRRYGVRGRFVDFTSLVHEIQTTFDPGSQTSKAAILDPVMEADVLVLDELGAQKPTEWVQNVLYLIINTRYTERRPTLFTTNYRVPQERPAARETARGAESGGEPGSHRSLDRGADPSPDPFGLLEHRISPQLVSRLYEMTEVLRLHAVDDYRREIKSRERHLVG